MVLGNVRNVASLKDSRRFKIDDGNKASSEMFVRWDKQGGGQHVEDVSNSCTH